jgi:hypothetical protein
MMRSAALTESLRTAKAGFKNEHAPLGVFLLAGPSGVGKTETALALADLLFGGKAALTTINMSEYQESHTVSQLKGSPPGYVGYGRGGILTEAVRQRPYSVVLLDDVEKAHRDAVSRARIGRTQRRCVSQSAHSADGVARTARAHGMRNRARQDPADRFSRRQSDDRFHRSRRSRRRACGERLTERHSMPAGPSLYDMLLGQIGGEPLDAYGDRTLECLSMQQNVQRILNTRAGNQRYVLPQRF